MEINGYIMYTSGPLPLKFEDFDLQVYKDLQSRIFQIISFHKKTQAYYFPKEKGAIILSTGLTAPFIRNESDYSQQCCVIQFIREGQDNLICGYLGLFSDNDGIRKRFEIPWSYLSKTDEEMESLYLADKEDKFKDDLVRELNLDLFLKGSQISKLESEREEIKAKLASLGSVK